jgi:peptide-methionine (S)-S-oxide reductase
VVSTQVGYIGGTTDNPTYEDVCSDTTGHAEAVQVEFDPSVITYKDLLEVFWRIHDPTTKNRQGPNVGSQYRSMIFYHNDDQRASALAVKEQLESSAAFKGREIVTEILPAGVFYRAEEYHQRYYEKHGLGSIRLE